MKTMEGLRIIIDCMMWLGAGFGIAAVYVARRLNKAIDAKIDDANNTYLKTQVLSQFTIEFNQCEDADDIIDLQQRWHDRLKEVGLEFNDIVKFERE